MSMLSRVSNPGLGLYSSLNHLLGAPETMRVYTEKPGIHTVLEQAPQLDSQRTQLYFYHVIRSKSKLSKKEKREGVAQHKT